MTGGPETAIPENQGSPPTPEMRNRRGCCYDRDRAIDAENTRVRLGTPTNARKEPPLDLAEELHVKSPDGIAPAYRRMLREIGVDG